MGRVLLHGPELLDGGQKIGPGGSGDVPSLDFLHQGGQFLPSPCLAQEIGQIPGAPMGDGQRRALLGLLGQPPRFPPGFLGPAEVTFLAVDPSQVGEQGCLPRRVGMGPEERNQRLDGTAATLGDVRIQRLREGFIVRSGRYGAYGHEGLMENPARRNFRRTHLPMNRQTTTQDQQGRDDGNPMSVTCTHEQPLSHLGRYRSGRNDPMTTGCGLRDPPGGHPGVFTWVAQGPSPGGHPGRNRDGPSQGSHPSSPSNPGSPACDCR